MHLRQCLHCPPAATDPARARLSRSLDSGLKRFVKDRQAKHQWDDADEAEFLKGELHLARTEHGVRRALIWIGGGSIALEGELDKVVKFQESKVRRATV